MNVLFVVIVIVILMFGFVLLYGAPYLPTLNKQINTALDMLDLKPGQTMVELGSGDGRVMHAAARRGIKVIGYELNPILAIWSVLFNWKYRHLITVHLGSFWNKKLPVTDGVYTFLLQKYMNKLNTKIEQDKKSWNRNTHLKFVSFAFKVPNKNVIKQKNGMYLYHYL